MLAIVHPSVANDGTNSQKNIGPSTNEGKSLGFYGTSLDVENFLKGKCVLVSNGRVNVS